METAQVILQLAGHHELLQAELARIVEDMKSLVEVSKRYPHLKELFVSSHRDLGKLKKQKEEQEREIRNHLQCYELHRPAGEKILKRLAKGNVVAPQQHQPSQSDLSLSSVSGPTAPALSSASKRRDNNTASTLQSALAAPPSSSLRGHNLHGGDLQPSQHHTSDTSYFDRHVHRLGEAISTPQQQQQSRQQPDLRGNSGARREPQPSLRAAHPAAALHRDEFATGGGAEDFSHHGINSSIADSSVL